MLYMLNHIKQMNMEEIQMRKKIIMTIAIIVAMMMAQFSVFINCAKAETITGSDGDVSWSFDTETQTLTFSGSFFTVVRI